METERPARSYGFRIIVLLAVLANLILAVALITQVRELQQRLESLPPDLASKRDVAMLRPLRVREILVQNCVECHSTRRLGTTLPMEPRDIQRTIERMQTHPGANIAPGDFERIAASLLVVRCARCHGEETLNLMVLKTEPERIATIRRMAATGSTSPVTCCTSMLPASLACSAARGPSLVKRPPPKTSGSYFGTQV